jgi:lysophospholipase L1-like esterase
MILKINTSLRELAEARGVHFLDIHSLFIDKNGLAVKDYLLDDGLHLSDRGYSIWSSVLEDVIDSFSDPVIK